MWTFFDKSITMKSRLQSLRTKKHKYSWDVLSLPQSVFKVVILGAGGVGKTSLVMRFVRDYFPQKYIPTVEDVYEKTVTLNKDFGAFFEIMDTAGSYQFPAMKRLTMEHGNAFVLVYSLDDESSLQEALRIQKEIIEIKGTTNVPILLVGNKTDLVNQEVLDKTRAQVAELVEGQNIMASETSAKFGVNVSGVFYALLGQIAVVNKVDKILKRDCLTQPMRL
ncbi:ras-related protein Rap-1-like [Actinia tenebrosa]|uniref:Ras-related protein Rap-1-like n=1 Tax=Actinia tenebrosa TaxID=6105 RepID=A0A6P8HRS2_ACTTE|nr:ras-related protein Rap-1-like [Actinia tenebrosa]